MEFKRFYLYELARQGYGNIGNNTYRFELPNGAEYAIFNNGSTQTGDLKIPDVNMIYSNGQWSKYSE